MAHGRWYPTATTLGDGSVMTFSGLSEIGLTNTTVEIYRVGAGWSPEYASGWVPPLYPRMHLLPNGNVVASGPAPQTMIFDASTKTWSAVASTITAERAGMVLRCSCPSALRTDTRRV